MISVCMATYNGSTFVREQCLSILSQLSAEDELLIQDDMSTDDTVDTILSIGDERIALVTNKSNIGYQKNFERVLSRAHGDLVFMADQDDIWIDGKVGLFISLLENHDVVISNAKIIGGEMDGYGYFPRHFIKGNGLYRRVLSVIRPRYLGCCMAFKKKCLDEMLPFPSKMGIIPHDYWMGTYSAMFFKLHFSPEMTLMYRRHSANVSNGGQGSKLGYSQQFIYRINTLLLAVMRKLDRVR